ncbi:hypothetical protein DYB37_002621 [Aphanomyces astaci]|uniref:Tubby C-terminal domain-containing protein n=1 Tax=Aphanomyces astaci TaxID=112090 RepID=A0A418DEK0_APHAT|nr:hypothetical protein DYB35_002976 [Aphanomyces astaci]RHZ03478.1 hypothetical protein DYB37_002621 [Aphanomyces astaci]
MGGCISTEAFDHAVLVPHKPMAVLHSRFTAQCPVTLLIKQKMWSFSGDDFTIKDIHTGTPYFKINVSALSLRQKKSLLDYSGAQVAYMEEPVLSWTRRQEVYTPQKEKWFEIKPRLTMFSNELDCAAVDSVTGQTLHFGLQGDFIARKSVITCDGVPVAKIWKPIEFVRTQYHVDIAPGVDMALIVLLCVALDEATEKR